MEFDWFIIIIIFSAQNIFLPQIFKIQKDEGNNVGYGNIRLLQEHSVITSIGYPSEYLSGISYTWTITQHRNKYIKLLFVEVSFRVLEVIILIELGMHGQFD